MKGYKVRDSSFHRTVGIACSSLRQLQQKGKDKLKIEEDVLICLEDGTIVSDENYFKTLPAQTVFVFYRPGQKIITGVDIMLRALRNVNASFLNAGAETECFFNEINSKTKELTGLLVAATKRRTNVVNKSHVMDDQDWFYGLETNAQTKEEYMFKKAQDRIRSYLYKAQDDIKKSNCYIENLNNCRLKLEECIQFFKRQLQKDFYFGCYFDRRCSNCDTTDSVQLLESHICLNGNGSLDDVDSKRLKISDVFKNQIYGLNSLCDKDGLFKCQGSWNVSLCQYGDKHVINPYSSREERIVFSTWNLDHKIEKSRCIIPTLISVSCQQKDINYLYFYQLMFTEVNLKLVHIVCHDKQAHNVQCEEVQCSLEFLNKQ